MTTRTIRRIIAAAAAAVLLAAVPAGLAETKNRNQNNKQTTNQNQTGTQPETDYAARLDAAREKYNAKTVNVYRKGWGYVQAKKINVCFYKSPKDLHYTINVRESLKITDEAEMEAILEVIMQNENYDEAVYGGIDFMKAQWITHNIAYEMATGTNEAKKLVSALVGEPAIKVAQSARELDLSPIEQMTDREKALTEKIQALFSAMQPQDQGTP